MERDAEFYFDRMPILRFENWSLHWINIVEGYQWVDDSTVHIERFDNSTENVVD